MEPALGNLWRRFCKEFLLKNKAEVKRMSIFEYNEEAVRRGIRDEAYAEDETIGEARGIAKSILLILEKRAPFRRN